MESISSTVASRNHARIFLLQAAGQAWKASEAVLFSRYSDSSMKRKLPSYSLKTSQTLGLKEQSEFVKNWPKEGMIVDGVVYPLVMWERDTKGKGGSCLHLPTPNTLDFLPPRSKERMWPTPRERNAPDCPSERRRDSPQLESVVNIQQSTSGKRLCPQFVELLMGYPIGWTELKPLEMQ